MNTNLGVQKILAQDNVVKTWDMSRQWLSALTKYLGLAQWQNPSGTSSWDSPRRSWGQGQTAWFSDACHGGCAGLWNRLVLNDVLHLKCPYRPSVLDSELSHSNLIRIAPLHFSTNIRYCTGAISWVSGCILKHNSCWIVSCMVCWTYPQLILTTRPLSPRKLLRQHQRQQLLAEFDNKKRLNKSNFIVTSTTRESQRPLAAKLKTGSFGKQPHDFLNEALHAEHLFDLIWALLGTKET